MRIKNTAKNVIVALIGQGLFIIISFISRKIFTMYLGDELMGLNGLFTDIIAVLSLVELGMGSAIIYSLYKPLANNDIDQIKSIMNFFKKVYMAIGVLVAVLGILMMPFLKYFKDVSADNLPLMFAFFVLNTSLTYFISYKRSILTADQKQYLINICHYGAAILAQILQIIVLIATKNYYLYLLVNILATILENILINIRVNRNYSYINDKNISPLSDNKQYEIKKNIKALLMHNIAGKVVNSTSGIIISISLSVAIKGFFDHYNVVFSAIRSIIIQIFDGLTASVGHIHATESEKKSKKVFNQVFFINFWIAGFSAAALYSLINPLIYIWLGEKYLFSKFTVFLLCADFYFNMIRQAALIFRRAYGLYWEDRYKAIVEAALNLILSITLVRVFGLNGIILSGIITTVFVCIWVEPLVVYKNVFKISVFDYFKRFIPYLLVAAVSLFFNDFIISLLNLNNSLMHFIFKIFITAIIPNLIFIIIFFKTEEFKSVFDIGKNLILNIFNKSKKSTS